MTAQEAQAQAILPRLGCVPLFMLHIIIYSFSLAETSVLGAENVYEFKALTLSLKGLLKQRQVYSSHNTVWYMEVYKLPVTQLMYSTAVNVRFAIFF